MVSSYNQSIETHLLADQKGFAMMLMIALLPVVLAAMSFLYVGTTQIDLRSNTHQQCRGHLMQVQERAVTHIKTLLALNPIVNLVKTTQIFTRIAQIVLVSFPVFAPILASAKVAEKSAVVLINSIQRALLIGLRTTSFLGLLEGRRKLDTVLQEYQQKTSAFLLISNQIVWINPKGELPVEATQPRAQLTTYRLRPNFQQLQTLSVYWRYKLSTQSSLLPFYKWQQVFSGHCSTTIEKEEPWKPVLSGDRLYWKFS